MPPSVQTPPGAKHTPGPSEMLKVLNEVIRQGYKIVAVAEFQFAGPAPEIQYAETAGDYPELRKTLPILMPHGNHWHLYIYELVKPEIRTQQIDPSLTNRTLIALASLAMDEKATVSDMGHA